MVDCLFCTPEQSRILPLTASFYGHFDNVPVSPGHARVVPYRHVVLLDELTCEEWAELREARLLMKERILSTDLRDYYLELQNNPPIPASVRFAETMLSLPWLGRAPDAYNEGVNDGRAAGRTIDHLHWHIIPRYEGDVPDPRGGIRGVIPALRVY